MPATNRAGIASFILADILMATNHVILSRRHVLGDFHGRCLPVVNILVFLDSPESEMIGYVDEGLGVYADAFRFYLSDELCKKLTMGHFTYSFDYEFADRKDTAAKNKRRIKLTSITLNSRKGYSKPEPKIKLKVVRPEVVEDVEAKA